jgi:hypothetical protein
MERLVHAEDGTEQEKMMTFLKTNDKITGSDTTVDDRHYRLFYEILEEFFKCLIKNGIYHNDTHHENVFFIKGNSGEIKIGVIDFGKATFRSLMSSTSGIPIQVNMPEVGLDPETSIVNLMKEWLSRKTDGILLLKRYGGKKQKKLKKLKKTSKYKRKFKSTKRKRKM